MPINNLINNLSVRQLTISITVILTVINGVVLAAAFATESLIAVIVGMLVAGGIGFLLVGFLLHRHVFRKLSIIYKIIRKSRMTPYEKEQLDDNMDYSLEAVNQEVIDWANKTNDEIATLKSLEIYRKEFVGNISHELKTPIFNMQGYLHTLLDGALEDLSINRKYIKKAASNLDRLQSIVEDLEAISKLEANDDIVDYRKFDLKELTADVVNDLDYICKQHEHTIIFKESSSRNYQVRADKGMIRQVLVNLLTNAVKYSKADSGTTVISFYDLDRLVLTEITDDGIGIDEKHLKHLFDRFYRVDSSRSRQLGGSGLGLSIVKHIIEAHHQTINVRSTPEVGSTFGFTLEKAR